MIESDQLRLAIFRAKFHDTFTTFLQEGGDVVGTVPSVNYRHSPIPEGGGGGGVEIPIHMTFTHSSKPIIGKMRTFIETKISKMDQIFTFEDDGEDDDEIEDIVVENDESEAGDSAATEASGKVVVHVIDDDDDDVNQQQGVQEDDENDGNIRDRVRREIDAILYQQIAEEEEGEMEKCILFLS